MRGFLAAVLLMASVPAQAHGFFRGRGFWFSAGLHPFVQAQVVVGAPVVVQPVMVQPVMVEPVVPVAAPMVGYRAPAQTVACGVAAPQAPWRPGALGFKYTPGFTAKVLRSSDGVGLQGAQFNNALGLELRLSRWFALRSDVTFGHERRTYDVLGAKLWLAGGDWRLKPYLSASLSATQLAQRPDAIWVSFVTAGGLDLFLGKHFFLEAELRYRPLPGASGCCSEANPQLSAVAGIGVAFF